MSSHDFKNQLSSDLRSKLFTMLKQRPGLSPESAMIKITGEMLKNNPFVPPEGDKCPVNILPDELLAHIFEIGVKIELEDNTRFGDDDDFDDEFGDEGEEEEEEEVIDVTEGDEDDENWSDVADEEAVLRRKAKDGDEGPETESDAEDSEEAESELPFQVLVSHVCKRWRAIALDSPALWILLVLGKGTPLDKHKAYIERSRDGPIDLLIDCTYGDSFDEEYSEIEQDVAEMRDNELLQCLKTSIDPSDKTLPSIFGESAWATTHELGEIFPERELSEDGFYSITEFSEILDVLIPHVQKWRVLSVSVSDYRWMYLLLARLHQCPPAGTLERIELNHYDDNDSGELFQPRHLAAKFRPFQGQLPHLRYCELWGVHLDWEGSLGIFKNVVNIELAYHTEEVRPSYETLGTMVKSSPNLEVLTLCLSGARGSEDDWRNAGVEPIQLPSLDGLILRYHTPEYARSLLRFIDTPNITSLVLDFDEKDYTEFAKDLCKAPFGRSRSLLAGLESLKISGLPCSRSLVERMLSQLANLKSLNLNCVGEGELFFETLLKTTASADSGSSAPGKKIYCPTLEAITTSGVTGKQMKEFIEARVKAGVPVKKLSMSDRDEMDASSERWLKEHVREFEYFDHSDSDEDMEEDDLDFGDGDEEDYF